MSQAPSVPLAATLAAVVAEHGAAAARERCLAHVDARPDDPDGHRHLAQLQAAMGLHLPALGAAMQACRLAPDDPRCWSDLGRVHGRFGEFGHATRCFQEAVEIDPAHADGWHNLGLAARELGKLELAFEAFKRVLGLEPARGDSWLALGSLLLETAQFADAAICFERALSHDPDLAGARSRLAEHWSRTGKVRRAEALYRQSLALDEGHVPGWFGLGRTLEDLGDADAALACYRRAIALRPQHAPAIGHYLALLREPADDALLQRCSALTADPAVADEAKAAIGYGAAQYHDRRGEHAAAAAAGRAANAARRRVSGPLDRAGLAARVAALTETCTRDFFRQRRRFGLGTPQPVFIVGLPRSGTTLVEQVIASHPRMHGGGELPDLARLAVRSVKEEDELWQAACRLDEEGSRGVASDYLGALREGAPRRCLRISDKSPLNYFHLAFAALLFPYARVIHCRRDPRDTALSIWMQNFNDDQRYATDFDDLACFTAFHERLMAHWHEHLPLPVLEVRYEDVVADLPRQARRLTDFLDVPWDASCLDFHRSGRAVQTPSRWQVRQPVYAGSVGRWKPYAAWLPELERAFDRSALSPGIGGSPPGQPGQPGRPPGQGERNP